MQHQIKNQKRKNNEKFPNTQSGQKQLLTQFGRADVVVHNISLSKARGRTHSPAPGYDRWSYLWKMDYRAIAAIVENALCPMLTVLETAPPNPLLMPNFCKSLAAPIIVIHAPDIAIMSRLIADVKPIKNRTLRNI